MFPGALSTSKGLEDEKGIPNIFLVETTNAKELEKVNPFIVRNGWFDKKAKKIDFTLEDVENIDNVILSFTAKKRKGTLEIKLNGNIIFESELASDVVEPVRMNKNQLQKTNSLEFSVSSVGFGFWTTNEYSLENVKIIGDVTEIEKDANAEINEDDIETVMGQTGCTREEALEAIEQSSGNLAEAILKLQNN